MPLAKALTLTAIKSLADAKTFARGLAYFHDGVVGLVEEDSGSLHANVQGTRRYHVTLSVDEDGGIEYDCNCPVGYDGTFCKHAVAVALSWLENCGEEVFHADEAAKPKKKRLSKAEQLRHYLESLPDAELRDLLMEAADRDRNFRDKLLFAAKSSSGKGIADLRSIINQATKVPGNLDWDEVWQYGERLEDLADLLEKNIDHGDTKLVELIEQAILQAESGIELIDDSNGEVSPAIDHLQEIHLQACARLNPDPIALADRLFHLQMDGHSDIFYQILPDYQAALGREGVARYEQLVEEQWNTLPALTPKDARKDWNPRRSRVESAMAELAKRRGDVDALIAIKSRDLSSPVFFLNLAELLKEHQRFDEALNWAEKGIAAFPKDRIDNLLAFAIAEHLRRKNADAAERMAWQRFEQHPNSEAFFQFLDIAKQIDRLDSLRQRALSHLESRVTVEESTTKKPSIWNSGARNILIEIHLAEESAEAMWITLKGGPTSTTLWEKCAAMRGKTHPEDAIQLYFKLLPMKIEEGARNARYEDAFRIVQAIGKLRNKQGQKTKFQQELARIRLEYKAKRNFIKALAAL